MPKSRLARGSAPRILSAALAVALLGPAAPASGRASKHVRRESARGEQTDTSARLSAHAFIDDRRDPPWRLAQLVDAFPARHALTPSLLPVVVGVGREGGGPPLPLSPDRFRLSWTGGPVAVAPLRQDELAARPEGLLSLRHDVRLAATSPTPLPFGPGDGLRVPTRFLTDPAAGVLLDDSTELPAGAWFADWLYFPVPADLPRWDVLFTLSFLGPGDEVLVATRFRVEEDPEVHRRAFRRTRKARRAADRREERERRRGAPAADAEPGPG